ncbi:chalcone isomerase family protein [Shewanella gelidii]|uniref:Chalcone isomerase n=1 Tax=Shewanella gelidii TaxID=1642821 RepID=A0A917JJS6_9GAMM|nr:chalcone isomerase family protein [Shewanella gelidii]MCL1096496.1 chalcone isomerase family protein [Shewanella gelidii]GGI67802.1 chalcone isomerase [Shewanella gelidii]
MKYLLATSLALLLLLNTNDTAARELADVEIKEQIIWSEQPLILNGAGIRSKFFMDLYVGSLYLPAPAHDLTQVLQQSPAIIRLNIVSGMITAEKMQAAIEDGFNAATHDNTSHIDDKIAQFMALFESGVSEGDQFTFVTFSSGRVTTYKNGKAQGQFEDIAFREALLGIWLGNEPAQNSLKEAMLSL